MKKFFLTLLATLSFVFSMAQDHDRRVVIIMLDGLRWQELFNGADTAYVNNRKYAVNPEGIGKLYVRATQEERRMALMPFTWGFVRQHGTIIGNRWQNSLMSVSNQYHFSYPGYSEILCGVADDARITSNDEIPNPNISVLEAANRDQRYQGRVMAFASWGTVAYILNMSRSGLPVVAGQYSKTTAHTPSEREAFLDGMKADMVDMWGDATLDLITYHYAAEAMRTLKPKVLYVGFNETDEFGHHGRYDHYLMAANHNDDFIGRLWKQAQDDPFYRDKTTFIVTTDHGRGSGDQWVDHGRQAPGSEYTWFMAFGNGIKPLGETAGNGPFYSKQIAMTVARLLGIGFTPTGGVKPEPLPVVEE